MSSASSSAIRTSPPSSTS
uniref:Uncharacterized protein n=1 Tax=Arundo donax TaxID=35708 RepID=A0A0A9A7P9_ARUDO